VVHAKFNLSCLAAVGSFGDNEILVVRNFIVVL
jgi:hypothetical protein